MKKLDKYELNELNNLFVEANYKVADTYKEHSKDIEKIASMCIESINKNGRVFYIGAGTSGRIGMLDALDFYPTYGEKNWFKYVIAGGDDAVLDSLEMNEDDFKLGESNAIENKINKNDLVIGLSASGNTKYVKGFLAKSKEKGSKTVLISNNKNGAIEEFADFTLVLELGNEVISGSTKLKAATMQKLILNSISTMTAIKTGKVYDEYMIDVKPINEKLVKRSINMIVDIANVDFDYAKEKYNEARQNAKTAIVMILKNIDYKQAVDLLNKNNSNLRKVIEHE
ncbi:N-acetylmuramic acid 6-phosphate etherase [Mycoplasma sp. CSL10137]|uniref:N-acetylmuramic acid 6-phosphate etherase n=1 Tax=unclassified Mycoplasma TaxID=2683645 RepID=UPI00197B3AA4|nr:MULTISPECIES: N-acetylmuramic acid 6-phosphate etherase [unclassified Mycoplasma]MBN4083466.1 N-acetylmuramic acid 6-phosphate etherase [Mycoplasma sp. CSL10137]MBN4084603.1 N-acetylmuramic acid 6-phosphate etherase [Mycoplasma sp. CSL10166]